MMNAAEVRGRFPFGAPLRAVVQQDRGPKRVFILGVYASAVHARWVDDHGKVLVRALAVASEPTIFWNGKDAAEAIAGIQLPPGAGALHPAQSHLNGPSGRALDEHILGPLGFDRADVWLCDLVPHACLNTKQARALEREYHPRGEALGLPAVDLPRVPRILADRARREAILREFVESRAELVVLLGDEPIKHWLRAFDDRRKLLTDFGDTDDAYGRRHEATIVAAHGEASISGRLAGGGGATAVTRGDRALMQAARMGRA